MARIGSWGTFWITLYLISEECNSLLNCLLVNGNQSAISHAHIFFQCPFHLFQQYKLKFFGYPGHTSLFGKDSPIIGRLAHSVDNGEEY